MQEIRKTVLCSAKKLHANLNLETNIHYPSMEYENFRDFPPERPQPGHLLTLDSRSALLNASMVKKSANLEFTSEKLS